MPRKAGRLPPYFAAEKLPVPITQPPSRVELHLTIDGDVQAFSFSFYQATWTGGDKVPRPRYVALCNATDTRDVYGEGLGWHRAMAELIDKLVQKGVIKGTPL